MHWFLFFFFSFSSCFRIVSRKLKRRCPHTSRKLATTPRRLHLCPSLAGMVTTCWNPVTKWCGSRAGMSSARRATPMARPCLMLLTPSCPRLVPPTSLWDFPCRMSTRLAVSSYKIYSWLFRLDCNFSSIFLLFFTASAGHHLETVTNSLFTRRLLCPPSEVDNTARVWTIGLICTAPKHFNIVFWKHCHGLCFHFCCLTRCVCMWALVS